ncbi:MAG: HAD family hydrolase [Clostridia bacterium]|nr:HAD family hydrolase [Clostridia bacterium]
MIKAIIFDLDGTLCDTLDDIRTGVNSVLERLGYKTRTKDEIHKFINNGARELIRRSLPKDVQGVDFILESALSDYNMEYAKCYCNETHAYEGIEELLIELKSMGYKLGVLSNKQDPFVKDIINRMFGDDTFTFVMGQSGFPPKPDPSSALYVAKSMGVKAENCIYVGDSDVDVETSYRAGMAFIGVKWGYRDEEVLRMAGASTLASTPFELLQGIIDLSAEEDA